MPAQLQVLPDSPLAELLYRLELSRLAATEACHEFWPQRLKGSCDITTYLQWHEKVRPGGGLHPPDEDGIDLSVRGKSTEDVSQALIAMMDHFHLSRANKGSTSHAVIQMPAGSSCDAINSLSVFFKSVRFYVMWVNFASHLHLFALHKPVKYREDVMCRSAQEMVQNRQPCNGSSNFFWRIGHHGSPLKTALVGPGQSLLLCSHLNTRLVEKQQGLLSCCIFSHWVIDQNQYLPS